MGMPRKGSRRAEIGNHLYLWRVMKTEPQIRRHGRSPGLHFLLVVQRDVDGFDKPGSIALFHLESRKRFYKVLQRSAADRPGTNLSVAEVKELVAYALEQGWDPEEIGPAFEVMAANEESLDLRGFSLAMAS